MHNRTKPRISRSVLDGSRTRNGSRKAFGRTALGVLFGSALLVAAGGFALTGEAQPADAADAPKAGNAGGEPAQGGAPDFAAMLIQGLKETEGCLGVDAAQFRSGKNTIVAWFENKEAAIRWYNHPIHRLMMSSVGAGSDAPLEHVTDPDAPIMVMASISFDGEPAVEGSRVPFSQISIEVYTPLPGGASINGRLSPKAFKIPHHKSLGG